MTKEEFNKYLDDLTSETGFDLCKVQKAFAYQAAKEYHKQPLRKDDVLVEQSEQFYCAEFNKCGYVCDEGQCDKCAKL